MKIIWDGVCQCRLHAVGKTGEVSTFLTAARGLVLSEDNRIRYVPFCLARLVPHHGWAYDDGTLDAFVAFHGHEWRELVEHPRLNGKKITSRALLKAYLLASDADAKAKADALMQRVKLSGFPATPEWAARNWGPSVDVDPEHSHLVESSGTTAEYLFDTDSKAPLAWLRTVGQEHPRMQFKLAWELLDGHHTGYMAVKDGAVTADVRRRRWLEAGTDPDDECLRGYVMEPEGPSDQ